MLYESYLPQETSTRDVAGVLKQETARTFFWSALILKAFFIQLTAKTTAFWALFIYLFIYSII